MARARMIKPDFWDDEKLSKISRDARLLFIGLWNYSDDYGVVKGNLIWLKNKIFPYDDIELSKFIKWIKEIEGLKIIFPFSSSEELFYLIKNFQKHQTINKPSQTRNPMPPGGLIEHYRSATVVLPSEVKLSKEEVKLSKEEEEGKPGVPPEIPNQEMEHPYKEYLEILSQIPKYPFDIKTDLHFLKEKEKDYSTIDILSLLKAWKTYLLDVPLNGKSRPRAQLHNQFELAVKYNKHKKIQKEPQAPSTLDKIKAAQKEIETNAG